MKKYRLTVSRKEDITRDEIKHYHKLTGKAGGGSKNKRIVQYEHRSDGAVWVSYTVTGMVSSRNVYLGNILDELTDVYVYDLLD